MTEAHETQTAEVQKFLEEVVPRQQAADFAIHDGDPEPRKALWSREDPVTVLGAFGVAASESFELEIIAAGVSGDLAYTVGYEHSVAAREGGPMQPNRLRVTHVYRRENGEWRIVHRHGDGLEANQVPS
jgi:SnoaL-like domain